MIQLEFFELSQQEKLEAEIHKLKESQNKLRKSIFARNSELMNMYNDLVVEFDEFKKMVGYGKD